MSAIAITPVQVWTATGTATATQFNVRYVTYRNGPCVADAQLLDANGVEVGSATVEATTEQTATWTDDEDFYAVLAENAGLTPA